MTRITGTLHEDLYTFFYHTPISLFQTNVVEKIQIHIACSMTIFLKKNRAVFEVMRKNLVEPDTPQMVISHSA